MRTPTGPPRWLARRWPIWTSRTFTLTRKAARCAPGLAAFTGVPAEYLLAGAGADELIDLLLRVLLEPDDCVINCPPTFGMYPFDTLLNAGQVIDVRRAEIADFSLDLPAIQAAVETRQPKVHLHHHAQQPGRQSYPRRMKSMRCWPCPCWW